MAANETRKKHSFAHLIRGLSLPLQFFPALALGVIFLVIIGVVIVVFLHGLTFAKGRAHAGRQVGPSMLASACGRSLPMDHTTRV